ncbi:MAG: DNA polymerase [Termitinemataceae bacterium]
MSILSTPASVVHINVIGFASAVVIAKNPSLKDVPFVVAEPRSNKVLLLDVSPRAREAGLENGMALSDALQKCPQLQVLRPDRAAEAKVHQTMVAVARRYSPVVEHDASGHLYLDLAGTSRLFGPPQDTALRIRLSLMEQLYLDPAVAVAPNKLTAKVVTRTLRPTGFAAIRTGEAADFMANQEITLLPGIGPSLNKMLRTAGIETIGDLAALDDSTARALLGRQYLAIRQAAQGLDPEPVYDRGITEHYIERKLQFQEPILEWDVLRGALMALSEEVGMALRLRRFKTQFLQLTVVYADSIGRDHSYSTYTHRLPAAVSLDFPLYEQAELCLRQALGRRVRLRGIGLRASMLCRDRGEQDLFVPEGGLGEQSLQAKKLQEALDKSRKRFGSTAILRGTTLLAQQYGVPSQHYP